MVKNYIYIFRTLAILLGFLQGWAYRHEYFGDVVSHIEIGEAYLRGDLSTALNGYFSPLYGCILGFLLFLLKPSPYWEYTVVIFCNFLIYLLSLLAFEFFVSKLIEHQKNSSLKTSNEGYISLPEWAIRSLGYSFFIFYSLSMISITSTTPDILVSAFLYLILGIILHIRLGNNNLITFILFGLVLGFSYLAKEVMFPLAFVFIVIGILSVTDLRKKNNIVACCIISFFFSS